MKRIVGGHEPVLRPEMPRSAIVRSVQWARGQDLWFVGLAALALACASIGISGLAPILSDDTFFLLNDAKWLLQYHEIPWTEHYSYTGQGKPSIYPLGGGLIFYGLWLVGGYALVCMNGAFGCALTTLLKAS